MTSPRQSTTQSRLPAGLMSLSILQLLGVVWRRKWIVLACMIVALSGAIIANGVATPLSTASATNIAEPRRPKIDELASVLSALPLRLVKMACEVTVIKSNTMAQGGVESLG